MGYPDRRCARRHVVVLTLAYDRCDPESMTQPEMIPTCPNDASHPVRQMRAQPPLVVPVRHAQPPYETHKVQVSNEIPPFECLRCGQVMPASA